MTSMEKQTVKPPRTFATTQAANQIQRQHRQQ